MDLSKMKKTTAGLETERKPVNKRAKRGGSKKKIVSIRTAKEDNEVEPIKGIDETITEENTSIESNDHNNDADQQNANTDSSLSDMKEPHMRLKWLHEMDPSLYRIYKNLPRDSRERVQTALTGKDHQFLSNMANLFDINLRDLLEMIVGNTRKKYGTKVKELRLREIDMDDF